MENQGGMDNQLRHTGWFIKHAGKSLSVICTIVSVLPPLSNSWIIITIWLIALNRTPNIDCYWGGSTQTIVVKGM